MNEDELVERIERLKPWERGEIRAPHKPLLILLALGRLQQGQALLPFVECESKLSELLREFGPTRRSVHPEYPFWRLQNDGLWQVSADGPLRRRKSNTDPPKTELRDKHAVGSFPEEVLLRLRAKPELIAEIAQRLLEDNFPESLHEDILNSVGLSLGCQTSSRNRRDPKFRARVLAAYEFRCALCGLDLRIGNITIALEAAHIKWHQAGGPDMEANGVALCSLHHKIFDLGAFTIHTDYRVLVSELAHGTGQFEHVLLRYHGQPVSRPLRPEHIPSPHFLVWHRREVFKEGPRYLEA